MSARIQAGIAEFLLVTRLRARSRPDRARKIDADVIERGSKIVQLTCKSWFAKPAPVRSPSDSYRTQL